MTQQMTLWRSLITPKTSLIAAALAVGTGGLSSSDYLESRGETGYPLFPALKLGLNTAQRSSVAADLASIRTALGISAGDVARMFNVSRQRIYDWHRGELPNHDRVALINELVSQLSKNASELAGASSRIGTRILPSGHSVVTGIGAGLEPALVIQELVSVLRIERTERNDLNESLRNRTRRFRGRSDNESIG